MSQKRKGSGGHGGRAATLFCIARVRGKSKKNREFILIHEKELKEYDLLHAIFAGLKSGSMTHERAAELSGGLTPHEVAKRLAELKPTHDKVMAMVEDIIKASRFSKVRASMQPSEISRRRRREAEPRGRGRYQGGGSATW